MEGFKGMPIGTMTLRGVFHTLKNLNSRKISKILKKINFEEIMLERVL